MIARLALAAFLSAAAACARPTEKACAEPVYVTIQPDGSVLFNEAPIAPDDVTLKLDEANAACGGVVNVFVKGYGVADRQTTEKILAAIEDAKNARIVGLPALGEDQ
jgi:biopolymer transport protein ExbD